MKLWHYIQGDRAGKEAHRIEKEAMKDPFLADALEGYEKTRGKHQRVVAGLQKQITNKSLNKKPNHRKNLSIAAGILIVVGIGTWLLLNNTPIAKDIQVVSLSEENASTVATVPEVGMIRDSTEMLSEKTPIAQATSGNAHKTEEQKTEVRIYKESILKDTMVMAEEEVTSIPQESTVMPQKDIMTRSAINVSVNDTASPQPVTGMQAYMDYIRRNMEHPADEECRNVKGSVVVVFRVGQSGRPYNIRVTQGLCHSINKEAIRLIINGPDWKKSLTSDEATITINF